MKNKKLFSALVAVAAANLEGFTVDAQTLAPVSHGYAVALAATQNSFGDAGLERVIRFVAQNANVNAFGGWCDSETGLFYWDATVIVEDLEQAKTLGRHEGQIAIFDLANCQEIRI